MPIAAVPKTHTSNLPIMDCVLSHRVRARGWQVLNSRPIRWARGAHPTLEVAWVDAGSARYWIGGKQIELSAGQAIVVPVQAEHQTEAGAQLTAGSVWLDAEMVSEVADSIGGDAGVQTGQILDARRIVALGRLLMDEAEQQHQGRWLSAESLAEALAVEAIRRTSSLRETHRYRDRRIATAIEYIETNFADAIGIDDVARAAKMSRFHFARSFRDHMGVSPYRYLIDLRVRRATGLLKQNYSVTEAAFAVGFSDLGRFGRAFRRVHGVLPSDARRTQAVKRAQSTANTNH